jgi:hypothetical protein
MVEARQSGTRHGDGGGHEVEVEEEERTIVVGAKRSDGTIYCRTRFPNI